MSIDFVVVSGWSVKRIPYGPSTSKRKLFKFSSHSIFSVVVLLVLMVVLELAVEQQYGGESWSRCLSFTVEWSFRKQYRLLSWIHWLNCHSKKEQWIIVQWERQINFWDRFVKTDRDSSIINTKTLIIKKLSV